MALQQLADSLRAAANRPPVRLDAAAIQAAGLAPPVSFDAQLAGAFVLPAGSGLALAFAPAAVGAVSNGSFSITNATLAGTLLNVPSSRTKVTLTFTQPPSGPLDVRIEVAILPDGTAEWSLSQFYTFMTDFPFTSLSYSTPTFIFRTQAADEAFGGGTVHLEAGQNFAALLKIPSVFQQIFGLLEGIGTLPATLPVGGAIDISRANDPSPVYPGLDLVAKITPQQQQLILFGLFTVSNPRLGVQILRAPRTVDVTRITQQTPFLYLSVSLAVTAADGRKVPFEFSTYTVDSTGKFFAFVLATVPGGELAITPATIIELMAGNSYFAQVPPILQQFLTNIQLLSIQAAGTLEPKPALVNLGASIGSAPDTTLVLFSDPVNDQEFSIERFRVDWTPTRLQPRGGASSASQPNGRSGRKCFAKRTEPPVASSRSRSIRCSASTAVSPGRFRSRP